MAKLGGAAAVKLVLILHHLPPDLCVPVVANTVVLTAVSIAVPKPAEFLAWAVHLIWVFWRKPQMLPFPPDASSDVTVVVVVSDPSLHSNWNIKSCFLANSCYE